jgi:hypothetical protein
MLLDFSHNSNLIVLILTVDVHKFLGIFCQLKNN